MSEKSRPFRKADVQSRSFITARERLIKVYFRHNCVRVVLNNLLTYSMLTNSLRAPLSCSDENILLIRGSLDRQMSATTGQLDDDLTPATPGNLKRSGKLIRVIAFVIRGVETILHNISITSGRKKEPRIRPKRLLYIACISSLLIFPPSISISSRSPGSFTIYPEELNPFFP